MIALSHPTGNEFVRALLSALEDSGKLDIFYTTVATAQGRRHLTCQRRKSAPGLCAK